MRALLRLVLLLVLSIIVIATSGCASIHRRETVSDPLGTMACSTASMADPTGVVTLGICAGSFVWDLATGFEIRPAPKPAAPETGEPR